MDIECLYNTLHNFLFDQCFPMEYTVCYISRHLLASEPMKIFMATLQNPTGHTYIVYIKKAKDGRSLIHKNWTKIIRDMHMEGGTTWAFRFFKIATDLIVLVWNVYLCADDRLSCDRSIYICL